MKILFVADGRSPIALNWISYFAGQDHEVHLVSTYPCDPELSLDSLSILPVAFGGAAGGGGSSSSGSRKLSRLLPVSLRTSIRQRLGPYTLNNSARKLSDLIGDIRPDLVHAMRIPYEGMLAALADPQAPLLISVWGNDFTLHAPSTRALGRLTEAAMNRAAALHTDCQRDNRLAHVWGFSETSPSVVLPGAGGVQADIFHPPGQDDVQTEGKKLTVINPRGFRAYVRNDTFFRSIPLVLSRSPDVRFICPAMQGEREAERWVNELGVAEHVALLTRQTREQMADLYRKAEVAVSPSTHDGTPNTLLEAMACGCLPAAGDIESLREWITPGVNGLLFDPGDAAAMADAVVLALEDSAFRTRAREENLRLIGERADYERVMNHALDFYQSLIS